MNASFYFTMFGLFTLIYLIVFIKTRFDYWEFRYNEVIHRRGVFADIKRYSTEDLRWFKEIPDVLERILAGSGRMILTTPARAAPDRDRARAAHRQHRREGRRHPGHEARRRCRSPSPPRGACSPAQGPVGTPTGPLLLGHHLARLLLAHDLAAPQARPAAAP